MLNSYYKERQKDLREEVDLIIKAMEQKLNPFYRERRIQESKSEESEQEGGKAEGIVPDCYPFISASKT